MGKLPGVIEPGRRPRQAMASLVGGGVTDDTMAAAMAMADDDDERRNSAATESMHARQTGDVHE